MKKILLLLALVILVLSGCKSDSDPVLEVTTAELAYLNTGEPVAGSTFTITSDTDWTIQSDKGWCSTSPTSGNGDATVTVTVTENPDFAEREAVISVRGADIVRSIKIMQASRDYTLSIPRPDREFDAEGVVYQIPGYGFDAKSIHIFANSVWEIEEIADRGYDFSWVTLSRTTGNAEQTGVIITVDPYEDEETPRSVKYRVKAGDQTQEISITQHPVEFDVLSEIPDEAFRAYLLSRTYDLNGNGKISLSEAAAITRLSLGKESLNGDMETLQGIEYFTEMLTLRCYGHKITSLDLSKNEKLEEIDCMFNPLTSIDVTQCKDLTVLSCEFTELEELDLSGNPELEELYCSNSKLKVLDVSIHTKLRIIDCLNNPNLEFIYVWEGFDEEEFEGLSRDKHTQIIVKP